MGPQGLPGESIVGPQGPPGADSMVPGPARADSTVPGPTGQDGSSSWATLTDKPDWTELISFSNIDPLLLPRVDYNYDIVVGNSVTPSTNTTYNLGQKDMRYLNVWSDLVACSNVPFHSGGNFTGNFSGSYNELREKPEISQPDYYEVLSFSPDKSLTLTSARNNLISGLNLETTGPLS